jgi:glycine/D-amino acid oxidase-like deaminating enzyme
MSAGPVMGKVIAEIVAGTKPSIDVTPFHPARFGNGRAER